MPDASPRSVSARRRRPPRAARSASRAGAARARSGRRSSGSCSAIQRSLVTVNEADGTEPIASAHAGGPPSSVDQLAACGAERRSFQSSAGRITWPAVVEQPPCRAAGRRPRSPSAPVEQPVARLLPAPATRRCGSTSVPSGAVRVPRRRPRRRRPGTAAPWWTASTSRPRRQASHRERRSRQRHLAPRTRPHPLTPPTAGENAHRCVFLPAVGPSEQHRVGRSELHGRLRRKCARVPSFCPRLGGPSCVGNRGQQCAQVRRSAHGWSVRCVGNRGRECAQVRRSARGWAAGGSCGGPAEAAGVGRVVRSRAQQQQSAPHRQG